VVSAAKPKIASYHFTTLSPNLGVVDVGDGRSFVLADLPGLIEGAHAGVGLGHEFLRHVERTRVLLHVVDMSGMEGRDPFEDWKQINRELALYNPRLLERPQIIVANKMDMAEAEDNLQRFRERLADEFPEREQPEIVPISAMAAQGIRELMYKTADLLDAQPAVPAVEEVPDSETRAIYRFEEESAEPMFTIRRDNDVFVVESPTVERLMKRTQLTTHDAVMRFARTLRKMGIDQALRERGAKDGQTIRIGDFEFEFVERE